MAFIEPMLASALPEGKTIADYSNGSWVLEEKYDGHRLILQVLEGGFLRAWSRNGKSRDGIRAGDLPRHIREAAALLAPGTYDGELFIPGHVSTDVTAIHLASRLQLVLFDMLRVGEHSAMARPGSERRELLLAAFGELGMDCPCLYPAKQFSPSSDGLQAIWDRGGEGAVIKRTMAIYRPNKRTNDWVKFKRLGAAEITITSFLSGATGPLGHDQDPYSIICGVDDHGVSTQVKSLNDEWRRMFAREAAQSVDGVHPRIGTRMVISYTEKHRSGNYREPRADHLLDD